MTWQTVALGDLVEIKGGGTPDKKVASYWGGDIPWASVKDFKSTELTETQETITAEGVANSSTQIIAAGNIIVPTRMAVGKAAINSIDLAINQDLKALFPKVNIDQRYLLNVLLASSRKLEDQATGATVKGIKLDVLRSLSIPLPPVEEQKRIAAILDLADALRRLRLRALDQLNTLGQSIFYEMFGEHHSECEAEQLMELVEEFRYGTSNKSSEMGYPALRIPNVVSGGLNLSEIKKVSVKQKELDRLRLLSGDLLFVRTNGNPDYVGRSAVFEPESVAEIHDSTEWIFASYLIRARLNRTKLNPVFLHYFLASPTGRRALRERCKTSAGQYNINTQALGSLPIPVPNLDEQEKFACKINTIRENVFHFEESARKLDALFSSLQHRAFRGEL